jgi:RND family efflux transporter MFP subunit
MKHPLANSLAVLALLLPAACGKNVETADTRNDPVTLGPENIAVVTEDTLRSGPTISGQLTPVREARMRAQASGAIVEIRAEQGQAVERGAVLGRIESASLAEAERSARAGLRQAEAALAQARRDRERSATLAAAGAIPERDLEQAQQAETRAEAAVADAKSRLSAAARQLGDATIRAPFRGVVSEKNISLGDVVQPGSALFTVVDPSSMELAAAVPARSMDALRKGKVVRFQVTGYPDRYFSGTIDRISPTADPATGQVQIYVAIPNTRGTLVGGLFAEGRVATETAVGPAIPRSALDERGLTPVVYRVRDARVRKVAVTIGLRDEITERVALTSGVSLGDTVLMGSAQGLADSTVVRIRQDPRVPADSPPAVP